MQFLKNLCYSVFSLVLTVHYIKDLDFFFFFFGYLVFPRSVAGHFSRLAISCVALDCHLFLSKTFTMPRELSVWKRDLAVFLPSV